MSDKNTRGRLIDAAFEEIYEKGYQGAALADILAKAGVHKGSMYHFFANKKELALVAIGEKMSQRFSDKYGRITKLEGGYVDALLALLRDVQLRDFRRGCPLANLVQEMSNLDADFDKALKQFYNEFRAVIKSIFDKALQSGELIECDTARLALFVTVVLEGAILATKATGEESDYLGSIDELAAYLGVYGRCG